MTRQSRPFLCSLVIPLSLVACGAADWEDWSEPDLAQVDQEVINGTLQGSNTFNAAVYHYHDYLTCGSLIYDDKWFSRPCSGTIVRQEGGYTWVLTARHCLDNDSGTPIPASSVRVTAALRPGPVPFGGSPPASAVTARSYVRGISDWALVKVPGSLLPAGTVDRVGLHMGPTTDLIGKRAYGFGYGRAVSGDCDGDMSSGAGQLRLGALFEITSVSSDSYTHQMISTNNEQVWHGDSGGPTMLKHTYSGGSWWQHTGNHTTTSTDCATRYLLSQIMGAVQYFYFSPIAYKDHLYDVATLGTVAGSNITARGYRLTDQSDRWSYTTSYQFKSTKTPSLCIQEEYPYARLRACSTSLSQVWFFIEGDQIRNQSSGRCLRYDYTQLRTATCSTTDTLTKWIVHLQQ
ncbi:MAG: trypsin-like serine protease [Polyangiaceae bacterium]|nr:trypsin-like serine protease [Polyangiaceae bacterium]